MSVSRPLAALAFGAALLAPALTSAQQTPRLRLDLADTDHDGQVSDAERAASLAEADADLAPVAAPADPQPRLRHVAHDLPPGPLDMARRIVPPSEFETLLEYRFNREVERRGKSKD
ncbi:hypothetical protein [Caulobacter sp. BE254]|uniref:hypothetical protein n=1 Tax=Caulobacter sp. BE254 TaxID=2817720 RepID=UPI002857D007|nr:hypothetical protein [Caulobacter sp. BE254]MDR7114853.1 hypothetical protein [Caulobacter sp. BE254]